MKPSMRSSQPSAEDKVLSAHFDALRQVPADDSLPHVQAWLHRVGDVTVQPRRLQHRNSSVLERRALRYVAAGLLLAAACTLPVEQEQTLAYVLSGRIAQAPAEARRTLAALSWVNPSQLTALGEVTIRRPDGTESVEAYVESGEATINGKRVITPTSKFAIVLPPADKEQVQAWSHAAASVPGMISVASEPVQESVKRPALQAALVSMEFEFTPRVSEEQTEARIQKHLEGLNMIGVEVQHVTLPNGSRTLRLSGPGMISPGDKGARRIKVFLDEMQQR